MKKSNKKYIIVALIVLLLALAVGYAAFTDTLTITGSANAMGSFDLLFESVTLTKSAGVTIDSVNEKNGTYAEISEDGNTATVAVKDLAYPGAGAEFTVVVKNDGTVPAILTGVSTSGDTDPDIVVTFPDFTEGEKIGSKETCEFTFTVEWSEDTTLDPATAEKTLENFELQLVYEQDTTPFTGNAVHTI